MRRNQRSRKEEQCGSGSKRLACPQCPSQCTLICQFIRHTIYIFEGRLKIITLFYQKHYKIKAGNWHNNLSHRLFSLQGCTSNGIHLHPSEFTTPNTRVSCPTTMEKTFESFETGLSLVNGFACVWSSSSSMSPRVTDSLPCSTRERRGITHHTVLGHGQSYENLGVNLQDKNAT